MPALPATDYRIQHLREKLGGLYELQALLGRGAFAAVYLVRNLRLDRLEAFKVLSDTYDHDEAFVRRFIHEAKLVASLDHPNIVKVYDFGEVDGIVWFSMQYVDGPTLRAELTARGRLSSIAVARLVIPLLGALDYSHQLGTVHRDIKPSNILLDRRSHPYIMDFGIAKSTANVLKTMTGRILGTPAYISPEQIQGEAVDGRADLYSLSIAMYEMLAGQTPFRAEDSLQTIVKRLNEDPDPLSMHCYSVDETLETIVMRGLARQPADRYLDAGAMRQALVEYLSEQSDQPEMILMTSAPEPLAIEKLPSTVPDHLAVAAAQETQTIKVQRHVSDSDASPPLKSRAEAWALALAAILTLAILVFWVPRMLRDDAPPSLVNTAVASDPAPPTATGNEQSAAESQTLEQELEETSVGVDPPNPSTETEEPLPAAAASAEKEAPGAAASNTEAAVTVPPSPPTETPANRAVSPLPQAPSQAAPPAPIRRPVTAPKILSAVEPALPSVKVAECAGQSVIISLRVGEDGKVVRSRILKAGPESCSAAARLAAEAYVFEPALDSEGQPVTASTTLNIRFSEVKE